MSDSVLDYYGVSDDYAMVKVIVGNLFVPKNLIELNLRSLFDVNVVGITRNNKFFIPKGTDSINPGDVVVVVGTRNRISKLDDFFNKDPEIQKKKEEKSNKKASEKETKSTKK